MAGQCYQNENFVVFISFFDIYIYNFVKKLNLIKC